MTEVLFPYGYEQGFGLAGPQLTVGFRFGGVPGSGVAVIDSGSVWCAMPEKWLSDIRAIPTYVPGEEAEGNVLLASGALAKLKEY